MINFKNQQLTVQESINILADVIDIVNAQEEKRKKDLINKFKTKKVRNSLLVEAIARYVTYRMLNRIRECGDVVEMVSDETMEKKKVAYRNSCGNRFCLICSWIDARKRAMMIDVCMRYIEEFFGKRFIFLTFTAKNVTGEQLPDEITRYNAAFKKLLKRKKVIDINLGCVRKLEVTYNKNEFITKSMAENPKMRKYLSYHNLKVGDKNPNYDTYHTHFHVLMAVNKSYQTSRNYISEKEWLELWRSVMKDDSITQVDSKPVYTKSKDDETGLEKSSGVSEIAKYAAKDSDYLVSNDVFGFFYAALKGRQVFTYNGVFKDAVKKYKNGELDKYKTLDNTNYMYFILYAWGYKEYVEVEKRLLNDEEHKLYNNMLLEDNNSDDDIDMD